MAHVADTQNAVAGASYINAKFEELYPDTELPTFKRLVPKGYVEVDGESYKAWSGHDFCISQKSYMVVTEKVLDVLKSHKLDYWVKTSLESLDEKADLMWSEYEDEYKLLQSLISKEDSRKAYSKVVDEILKDTIHSILVMLDGGDELTDQFNIDIINADTKKSLKEDIALHEEFFSYLLDVEETD